MIRIEFPMTNKLLNVIAPAAKIGFMNPICPNANLATSGTPPIEEKIGYSAPAAIGMRRML